MHHLRFIPIRLTILLIAGILTAQNTGLPLELPFVLAGTALLLLALKLSGLLHIPTAVHGILIALITFSLGMLCYAIAQPENQQHHYLRHDFNGRHFMYLRIREVWRPTAYSSRYLAMLEQVDCLKVKGGVLLNITPATTQPLKVDALLLVRGSLAEIKPNLNPFQFNYGSYLKNLGIPRQLTSDSSQIVLLNPVKTSLYGKAEGIRDRVVSGLKEAGMGNEALSIINALLLGQRTDISKDTFTAFRDAGAIHILAVSGLHIGILLLLLNFLLRPLDRLTGGRGLKLCLLLILLWSYALLAGFTPSIIRAVSMFSFVAYALYLNRPANNYNILALSVFFILLAIDPGLLFQVGFQMSYAAVFAIVWFLPLLHKIWAPRDRIMRQFWQLLSVSLAAQIGVLPISLFYFHQFPGLFFLSNLLIIPFLGILLGFGFLVASMAYTVGLPKVLADLYELLINMMTGLVRLISEQEAFIFKDIPFAIPELLLLYLLIVLLAQLLAKYSIGRVKILLLAVMLLQCQICWLAYSTHGVEKVWVLHRPRQTLLMHQAGDSLFACSAEPGIPDDRLLTGFKLGTRCRKLSTMQLRKAYRWNASSLVVLGANSGWPAPDGRKLYLLMTGSPKIHMGRLLDSLKPVVVVADGSNYPSYAARWKASCEIRKIAFHYTGTDGAYCLQIAGN